jgi:RNA polymerase sigma-70 factor (ECF subfamily)
MQPKQFEAFLAEHRPLLVARAERITGDPGTAEDVVQTTSIYLLTNIHRYDDKQAALLTWVLGAVTRRAYNVLRAQGRYLPLVEEFSEGYGGTVPGVDAAFEQAQKQALLTQMREVLKGDPTLPLAERLMSGETIEQIAESEGVAGQTLAERLTWAFKRWRKLLARKFTRAEIETALGR